MKKVFRKLLLGNFTRVKEPEFNPIQKRIQNIKAIWNNDHQDDNGIENCSLIPFVLSVIFSWNLY
jgi:hypothetical protein